MVNFSEMSKVLEAIKPDGSLNKKEFKWRSINSISKSTKLTVRKVVMALGMNADQLKFKTADDGKFMVMYSGE